MKKSAYMILGLLGKSPMSGYDIKKLMGKIGRFYWSESNAQIYPILKQLEKKHLVESEVDKSSGARQKRVYSLTKEGKAVLMEWLPQDCELTVYREEILTKMALGQLVDKDDLRRMLEDYRRQLEDKLEDYDFILEHIQTDHKKKADQPYLFIVYEHVKAILDAKMNWVESALKKLP